MNKLYEVVDVESSKETFPSIHKISATDEGVAATRWAEAWWANHDYPSYMECFVTDMESQQVWRVNVTVESQPVFYSSIQKVK